MVSNCFISLTIHVLQSTKIFSKQAFDFGETVEDFLEVVSFENYDSAYRVDFRTVNVELRDYSESTFSSDEQLLQIIARVVLHYLRAEVQNLSIWSHCLQSEDVRSERTVFDDILPSCVCCCVSSYMT